MTKEEFNKRAAAYCGFDTFDLNSWHDASRLSMMMSLEVRPAFHRSGPIDHQDLTRGHKVEIRIVPCGELVSREAPTRPLAVCRCISAALGWGEIEEEK